LYNSTSIKNSKNKCKRAWELINSFSKNKIPNKDVIISPNEFNNYCVSSVEAICKSVVSPNQSASDLFEQQNSGLMHHSFRFNEVTPQEVLEIVHKLKPSDSVDIYDMSSNIIKKIIDCVLYPLTFCINKCLMEGIFPNVLKLSRVVPVFKKGEKDNPASYRPISLIPIFSKILEYVIFFQVCNYLEVNKIISDSQFGFCKGKSTVDAIHSLVKKIYNVFENKESAQVIFCDLSKAFDCVNHLNLLNKLNYYGFTGTSLELFKSYLNGRSQIVSINKLKSDVAEIKCGVPQGSVLGPLLFILTINDLPKFIQAHTILYADDTSFLCSSSDLQMLQNSVRNTLTQANIWFSANGFLLNEQKTQNLIFSLKETLAVDIQANVKFLGVVVDSKLSWEPHIVYVNSKLSRVVYLLKNLKNYIPENYVRSAYFAFFQSIMSYGILVWGNSAHISDTLIIQKKIIRILSDADRLAHCKPLFIKLKIMTVINLYIYTVLCFTKQHLHEFRYRKDFHPYITRNSNQIQIPYCRLTKTLKSYEILGLRIYNRLPSNITSLNGNAFKNRQYNWLLATPFYSVDEFLGHNFQN